MMSQTSLEAYQRLKDEGALGKRQSQVWAMLRSVGPCNNRELAEAMEWSINRVTGRINELDSYGFVRLVDIRVDPKTDRSAKVWEAVR